MEMDLSALDAVMAAGEGAAWPSSTGQGGVWQGGGGTPLSLPLDLIDEDPLQPRTAFDEDSLAELAATIASRGVRQPISVRSHPDVAGRWKVNFGARRLRASRLAGLTTIPAFVDETADTYDQVIENEQRQGLQPLELALFIERRLKAGESQAEVARQLGKSRMYVTYLCVLIDAPDWLMTVYRSGKCRGMTELYELARLHDEVGPAVVAWAEERSTISRSEIKLFKQQLLAQRAGDSEARVAAPPVLNRSSGAELMPMPATASPPASDTGADPGCSGKGSKRAGARPRVLALWGQEEVELTLDVVPEQAGMFWVRPCSGGDRQLVAGTDLTLSRFAAVG